MLKNFENSTPVLSISQLNRLVSQSLADNFPRVVVCGEISNCKQAPSGHWYLSLKDANAVVRAVFFRQRAMAAALVPRDGSRVEVEAAVTLYETRGDYQLVIDTMRAAGQGNLHEQFAALKARLLAEGLLESARKRPVPAYPRKVGVITSLRAAALQDVLTALARRAPALPVVVYPAAVQGPGAPAALRCALDAANIHDQVDVLVLCRGGGSIEDLWAFNDEALVRAVAASRIPVVSGVGHETDFTLVDFVSDQRMPTPTAAAEWISAGWHALPRQLLEHARALRQQWQRQLARVSQRLDGLAWRLQSPQQRLAAASLRLENLRGRWQQAMLRDQRQRSTALANLRNRFNRAVPLLLPQRRVALDGLSQRLIRAHEAQRSRYQQRLFYALRQLEALAPQRVLDRGYAIALDAQQNVITQAQQAMPGQILRLRLAQGGLTAQVLQIDSA